MMRAGGGWHVVQHCDWMEQTAAVMTVQWGVGLHASTPSSSPETLDIVSYE